MHCITPSSVTALYLYHTHNAKHGLYSVHQYSMQSQEQCFSTPREFTQLSLAKSSYSSPFFGEAVLLHRRISYGTKQKVSYILAKTSPTLHNEEFGDLVIIENGSKVKKINLSSDGSARQYSNQNLTHLQYPQWKCFEKSITSTLR